VNVQDHLDDPAVLTASRRGLGRRPADHEPRDWARRDRLRGRLRPHRYGPGNAASPSASASCCRGRQWPQPQQRGHPSAAHGAGV